MICTFISTRCEYLNRVTLRGSEGQSVCVCVCTCVTVTVCGDRTFGGAKGRGVRAVADIPAGSVIAEEQPLVVLQSARAQDIVRACSQCLRPVGPAADHVLAHASAADEGGEEGEEAEESEDEDEDEAEDGEEMKGGEGDDDDDDDDDFALPPLSMPDRVAFKDDLPAAVSCACGMVFCGDACRAAAMEQHHWLLCTASAHADVDGLNAPALLLRQAYSNNEVLVQCARAVALALAKRIKGASLDTALYQISTVYVKEPW